MMFHLELLLRAILFLITPIHIKPTNWATDFITIVRTIRYPIASPFFAYASTTIIASEFKFSTSMVRAKLVGTILAMHCPIAPVIQINTFSAITSHPLPLFI